MIHTLGKNNPTPFVEHSLSIDSLKFLKEGFFSHPESQGSLEWHLNDKKILKILYYRISTKISTTVIRVSFENDCRATYDIPTVTTECHYGGVRPWFLCPYMHGDKSCYRRVRYLYLPYSNSKIFRCRQCAKLVYSSSHNKSGQNKMLINVILKIQDQISRSRSINKRNVLIKKLNDKLKNLENLIPAYLLESNHIGPTVQKNPGQ